MATNNKPEKQKRSKVSNPKVTKNPGPIATQSKRLHEANQTIKHALAFGHMENIKFGYAMKALRIGHKMAAAMRVVDNLPAYSYKSDSAEEKQSNVIWVDSFGIYTKVNLGKLLAQRPVHQKV